MKIKKIKASASDIELFIRNLQAWKIALGFIIVFAGYYFGYTQIAGIKSELSYKNTQYQSYIQKAQEKYKEIEKLKKFKSNTIFLMSKLQTLNLLKEILTRSNFSYTIYIKQPAQMNSIAGNNKGVINVNRLTAQSAKMGIYKYIPLKIVVKNYIDFSNLLKTIREMQRDANFILTGVTSLTMRGSNTIMLEGKLYVK